MVFMFSFLLLALKLLPKIFMSYVIAVLLCNMHSILDNTPIQCLHGKVPAANVGSIKRLSSKAWTKLFSKVFTCIWSLTIMHKVCVMLSSYFLFVDFVMSFLLTFLEISSILVGCSCNLFEWWFLSKFNH